METMRSKDGTTIAYDRAGDGPAVILVGGALSQRRAKPLVRLARLLSTECTVVNYDRRGRGDSDEASPFAVQREIEDLAAASRFIFARYARATAPRSPIFATNMASAVLWAFNRCCARPGGVLPCCTAMK